MTGFTAEELADLAAYDATVDAAPVTREDRQAARGLPSYRYKRSGR